MALNNMHLLYLGFMDFKSSYLSLGLHGATCSGVSYRTVQQSATVTIESDRELTTSEIEYIRNKAEDETSKLSDYDWKDEEVDDKVDVTIYDGNTYYLT